jgi:anti-sigma factor RsiW
MPNCNTIDPLVTPYVDGELTGAARDTVAEHARVCPPCHSRIAAERAVRELIHARRDALACDAAPPALRARCRQAAAHLEARAASERGGLLRTFRVLRTADARSLQALVAPYALAASLILIVSAAFVYQATDKSARVMAAELAADHVKCFAMNSVLSTHDEASAVQLSMVSRFGWDMHLPDEPSRAGLQLVGARPCLYGEGRIAHIMYLHDGHPVSLFMLPNSTRSSDLVEVLGHEAAIWCVNNRTFVLVAREPRREVEQLASFIQASLR